MKLQSNHRVASALAASALALLASCSSGGGGGGTFGLESISLPSNATWQINRPIKFTFTEPVDLKTVSLNTINIRAVGGGPSAGEFYLESPKVVVFQPRCPVLDDLSDAGFQPGGVTYELNVLGIDKKAPLTVKSTTGVGLAEGDVRTFTTPNSTLPLDLFFDSKVGPPIPLVRTNTPSDMTEDACYIELGGDPTNRVYFRIDSNGVGMLDPLQDLPLNRLSQIGESVALMLHFNQAVDPSGDNVNSSRLSWQFDAAPAGSGTPVWTNLSTDVELVTNCTDFGALIRIEPLGILPPNTDLRVVVAPEFSDIVGQINLLTQSSFARAVTEPPPIAPAPLPDQFLDTYASAAELDSQSGFAEPPAVVGDGRLAASFSFTGTGGVNGEFDWKIATGQTLIFNTDSQNIVGGPNFISQYNVTVVGGVVDVRNMRIEAGGTLKVQGTKPMTILASGFVEILGTLDIRGGDSIGVVTLNTTNIPEVGATGVAGGGRGGTGSPLITSSSPKGGNGFGAFNSADGGGVGGETGWTNVNQQVDARRGAGGGGGTFGANKVKPMTFSGTWDQTFIGLDGEPGFPNLNENVSGASTGLGGPFGGAVGPSPFVDSASNNNFWGQAVVGSTLIQGELKKPWAGAGGGGGGDSAFVSGGGTFPSVPFKATGDEKGGPGGGGGGSLQIMALGNIVFGINGKILCRGGSGGGGENTSFVNRVGGAGGGGSGGHVILQTAGVIDMSLSAGPDTTTNLGTMLGGILVTGGQGGAGRADLGGAKLVQTGKIDTDPIDDACPPGYPSSGNNACRGHIDGAGGDGSPGLIQMHTPNGLASILLPAGKTLATLCKPTPLFADGSGVLVPSFGQFSRAQSTWIPLGEGGFQKTGGTFNSVTFSLEGTDPLTGLVLDDGSGGVQLPSAILPTGNLVASPGVPSIAAPRRIVLSGAGIDADYAFLLDPQNTSQLEHYALRMQAGATVEIFDVVAASYASGTGVLTLDVDPDGPALSTSFGVGSQATLHPVAFRVYSNNLADKLPASSTVTILMEATTADPVTGQPDPGGATGFVSDVDDLNTDGNNSNFRFVRYQVLFDLAAGGGGLTADLPVPSIDFLRLPFRYE